MTWPQLPMHYVYILYSDKDGGLYIGESADLQKRIQLHNSGSVRSTKHRRPIRLVHYEAFTNSTDAKARERYLKSGYGREQLNAMLKNLFRDLGLDE